MKVYKLKYATKEEAIADLLSKGVLIKDEDNNLIESKNTLGISDDIKIKLTEGVYNDEFEEVTPPTFLEGYHIDVACLEDLHDFGDKETKPNNPRHNFA